MASLIINIILLSLFFVMSLSTSTTEEVDPLDAEMMSADRWVYRRPKSAPDFNFDENQACLSIHPLTRDIVKRFYALLPYFRKENSETVFLHKFRGTIYSMSESDDILDRETAFYATVLTPILFLQNYRDTWCLLERFHRSLRLFQMSHPTEKRSALKLLQNLRPVNQKVPKVPYKEAEMDGGFKPRRKLVSGQNKCNLFSPFFRGLFSIHWWKSSSFIRSLVAVAMPTQFLPILIREMILDWPGSRYSKTSISRTTPEEEPHDQKEIRFVKELIKNLG